MAGTAVVAVAAFIIGALFYSRNAHEQQATAVTATEAQLVRKHAPILGPKDAPITIVEFFDPSCEACRAFYPVVGKIMAAFPGKVRVVLRYAPFHQGSDEAVRILETARRQGVFEPVLEALLREQPAWASHDRPDLSKAWEAAREAGLDTAKTRAEMLKPEITEVLRQDIADLKAAGVERTPTFFVNGKPLPSFGAQQLYDLVTEATTNAGYPSAPKG